MSGEQDNAHFPFSWKIHNVTVLRPQKCSRNINKSLTCLDGDQVSPDLHPEHFWDEVKRSTRSIEIQASNLIQIRSAIKSTWANMHRIR